MQAEQNARSPNCSVVQKIVVEMRSAFYCTFGGDSEILRKKLKLVNKKRFGSLRRFTSRKAAYRECTDERDAFFHASLLRGGSSAMKGPMDFAGRPANWRSRRERQNPLACT
jgi:hypothetical protein